MTENKPKSKTDIAATIVSVLFHPVLIPVYGLVIILSAPTLFGYLPFQVKKILLFIIVVNNIILPISLLPWFKYRNHINSWSMESREERVLPLVTSTFFYCVTFYIFWKFHIPVFIKTYVFITAGLAVAVTVINFWWKISVHAVGAGALPALVVILSITMHAPLLYLLIASVLVSGLVLTSRLWLNSHKPAEVWGGFLLGVAGSVLFLFLF